MAHDLFEAARDAMKFAHAPYSKFPVGAAIRADDGKIYLGANIEALVLEEGAGDLFGVKANGPHQIDEVGAQTVERGLNVMQLAIGLAQFNVPAEVALGPGRQGWREVGQHACQPR